jgi:hypothetical protein
MGESADTATSQRLARLAAAYGIATPTLDAVADAIVGRTQIDHGVPARNTVRELTDFVLEDESVFSALEKGDPLPDDVQKKMADLIASDPPATVPEWNILQNVLLDLRSVLHKPKQ